MREKWKIASECVIIAVAFTLLIIILNRIVLPFYQSIFAKDITLGIVATGQCSDDSLGTNVRVSKVVMNGVGVDFSKIELTGNWEYLKTDDFLYVYDTEKADALTMYLPRVTSLEVSFVSEVGSGIVDLNINGQPWKSVDLYSDSDWSTVTFQYDTSPLVHPEKNIATYFILFALTSSVTYLLNRRKRFGKQSELLRFSKRTLLLAALALLIYINICIIQFSDTNKLFNFLWGEYLVVLEGYILIFLILLILDLLISRTWISFSVLAFPLEILAVISNIKIAARGTPLLPWDFSMIGEALSVADGYDVTISALTVFAIVDTVSIAVGLYFCRKQDLRTVSRRTLSIGAVAAAAVFVAFFQSTVYPGIWNQTDSSRVYQVSQYYDKKGFVVAFAEYTSYLLPQKEPEGYSENTIESLSDSIIAAAGDSGQEEQANANKKPNIIVVMSESFWDINRLEHVQFAENPLPVFTSIQQEALHGNLLCHVFGGNTVVSEFEALTGFNGAFFPADYMVYGGFIQEGFQSAVSVLENQGYSTLALHPYVATNYNRNVAYDYFGFDQCLFVDDFSEDTELARNYVSDRALFERMETEFERMKAEKDAPVFMFAVTMQNHGGYWGSTLIEDGQVVFTADGYDSDTVDCMNDYFAGLHTADQALEELISYFREVDEETIVVFFGDHMSDAGTKYEKMLSKESWYDEDAIDYEYQAHLVPFLIWNNKNLVSEDLGLMEIGQLMPTVFEKNNLPMPYLWKFVLSARELYAAESGSIVVNPDLSVNDISEMSDEQRAFRDNYELLQYDYIWGSKYGDELWQTP